jgi:hypothetical protein
MHTIEIIFFAQQSMFTRKYLIDRFESRFYRLDGILFSSTLPTKLSLRQSFLEYFSFDEKELPSNIDLRSTLTPIEDRSQVGSW